MDLTQVLSQDFLTALTSLLEAKASASTVAVTRAQLCDEMGIDQAVAPLISMVISAGLVPGFSVSKGVGIYKTDAKTKQTRVKQQKEGVVQKNEVTVEFVTLLAATLDDLLPEDTSTCVTRKLVSETMGSPGLKTERLISLALNLPDLKAKFQTRLGPKGGVCRKVVEQVTMPTQEQVEALVDLPDDVVELDDASQDEKALSADS